MVCFTLLLLLWILREPQIIPGFSCYFKKGYVTDATSAIFVVILLFAVPDRKPMCCTRERNGHHIVRNSLLDWPTIQERFPWSVVLLLGGGFALAAGVKESRLSHEIGEVLQHLTNLPTYAVMFICVLITVGFTNICSNAVIATIFIPIVAELARSLDANPLLYMLPVAVSSSFAFLFPVATPSNAIVFGTGLVNVGDMAFSGFFITIGCMVLSIVNVMLWGRYLFALNEFPLWAYDDLHPMKNVSLIEELLAQNKTVFPDLPFAV